MAKERKSFILHKDSLTVLDELSDEEAGRLFKAIKAFQNSEEVELDGLTRIALHPFKAQFERDIESYSNVVNRNKVNGAKGGRPKKDENPKKPTKTQINPVGYSETESNPTKPRKADSDSDSDSDSKSDSKSDSLKTCQATPDPLNNSINDIFEFWKITMQKSGNTKLDAKRKSKIQLRLKDGYSVDQIKIAITNCSQTPHNMGANDRGQKYNDIELICRDAANLERFLEANPMTAITSGFSNDKVDPDNLSPLGGNY